MAVTKMTWLLPAVFFIGCLLTDFASGISVKVKTGDSKRAGTDARVYIKFYDDKSRETRDIRLNNWFSNDFQRGHEDTFYIWQGHLRHFEFDPQITRIDLWRNNFGFRSDWFVDFIEVITSSNGDRFMFPVFRWIVAHFRYSINLLDTSLPQNDPFREQRTMQLELQRQSYQYTQFIPNGPVQVKEQPIEEEFDFSYRVGDDLTVFNIALLTASLEAKSRLRTILRDGEFSSLKEMREVYDGLIFPKPRNTDGWMNDEFFGRQRLAGTNPAFIRRATEIPSKFPVTDKMVKNLLQGLTLQEAIDQKRLFITDYVIMEGIPTIDNRKICKPLAFFFTKDNGDLVPIAIQLFQTPGPSNPIFTPEDDINLWRLVKIWYNNADANLHQAISHLGNTHLLMEGVTITFHRALSQSHPLYKLMAPHFLYIIAINRGALGKLLAPGEWIDRSLNAGSIGVKELVRRGDHLWRMNVEGTLPEDLKNRGVDDPNVLPGYYYREDASDLYQIIMKYVTSYVNLYYTGWIPTSTIYFSCYQNMTVTEKTLLATLPNRPQTFSIMTITRILSNRGTERLGYFETDYIFDPRALVFVDRFRAELRKLSDTVKIRSQNRTDGYDYLDPESVPNSISI